MSKEELQKSLNRLRREIDKLEGDNELVRERVSPLINDLEHQLENPDDARHRDPLMESVREFIEQFEVEHPRITGIFNDIMVTLSNMGI
ncbi:MAG: DUF4404 family protein [Gammaproteobacteria bacterium]|nr:DUF4404 family protein [Gammaproteobacteria bacterium]